MRQRSCGKISQAIQQLLAAHRGGQDWGCTNANSFFLEVGCFTLWWGCVWKLFLVGISVAGGQKSPLMDPSFFLKSWLTWHKIHTQRCIHTPISAVKQCGASSLTRWIWASAVHFLPLPKEPIFAAEADYVRGSHIEEGFVTTEGGVDRGSAIMRIENINLLGRNAQEISCIPAAQGKACSRSRENAPKLLNQREKNTLLFVLLSLFTRTPWRYNWDGKQCYLTQLQCSCWNLLFLLFCFFVNILVFSVLNVLVGTTKYSRIIGRVWRGKKYLERE